MFYVLQRASLAKVCPRKVSKCSACEKTPDEQPGNCVSTIGGVTPERVRPVRSAGATKSEMEIT